MYEKMNQGFQRRKTTIKKNVKSFMNNEITYHNESHHEEEIVQVARKQNKFLQDLAAILIPVMTVGTIIYSHEKSLERKVQTTPPRATQQIALNPNPAGNSHE